MIPEGYGWIDYRAFADSAVRTVYIPDSVVYISDEAFAGCGRLIFRTSNQTAMEYAAAPARDWIVIAP